MAVSRAGAEKEQGKPGESCQKVIKFSKKQREQNTTEQQQTMGHVKGTWEPMGRANWPELAQFEQQNKYCGIGLEPKVEVNICGSILI